MERTPVVPVKTPPVLLLPPLFFTRKLFNTVLLVLLTVCVVLLQLPQQDLRGVVLKQVFEEVHGLGRIAGGPDSRPDNRRGMQLQIV